MGLQDRGRTPTVRVRPSLGALPPCAQERSRYRRQPTPPPREAPACACHRTAHAPHAPCSARCSLPSPRSRHCWSPAPQAQADTTICEQYGSTVIQGRYVVQNNRWGTSATQCVTATDTGFRLTRADGAVPTNGAPKSYPSVFDGCHYTNCSPGTRLPARLSSISSAPSSITYGYVPNAVYNASYDIWLDPTPRTDGVNRTEIMIWFNRVGPVQPIGSRSARRRSAVVPGRCGPAATAPTTSCPSSPLRRSTAGASTSRTSVRQAVARGLAQEDWYLTSIQAGFEPWENGAGLAVHSFSSTVNTGSGPGGPGDPSDPGDPGDPAPTCRVSYAASVWQGGFTANVTVTNTGSAPVDGWQLAFTLPSGQQITHAWNATSPPRPEP